MDDLTAYIRSLAPQVPDAIRKAARLFGETPRAVKGWYYRERRPRPETAQKIVKRSKGSLSFAAIYGATRKKASAAPAKKTRTRKAVRKHKANGAG